MTLHRPQKDSPSTYLTTAIDSDDTTLVVADSSIFSAENITRLTLGYDTATTETVTVGSYGAGNIIVVERGTPAYSWASGTTKVARVLTAQDILDIHLALSDLNANYVTYGALHDHQGGDGAQIPTEGIQNEAITAAKIQNEAITAAKIQNEAITAAKIQNEAITAAKIQNEAIITDKIQNEAIITDKIQNEAITAAKIQNEAITAAKIQNEAITAAKIQNRRRRVHLSSMGNGSVGVANTFVHGSRIKYSPTDAKYASFYGIVPEDFLSDGILYVLISNFISMTAVNAYINVGVTRYSMNSYLGGFMELETTLNVPGGSTGDPHYIIRIKEIQLDNIQKDDYIIGGVRLGSESGGTEVVYQGAFLDYLADS